MAPARAIRFSLADTEPAAVAVDALLVGIGAGPRRSVEVVSLGLTAAQAAKVVGAARAVGATAKSGEILRIPAPAGFAAGSVVTVGLGTGAARADAEGVRRAYGTAIRTLGGSRRVAIAALPDAAGTAAAALGARLAAYRFDDYRGTTRSRDSQPPGRVVVLSPTPVTRADKTAIDEVDSLATAVTLVRDLVDTPPNALPPAVLAQAATDAVADLPIEVTVWDEAALEQDGCGGILAVGMGSSNPPRLVRLAYGPKGATAHLALVGKGITFDTGGISIKPASSMDHMKADMAGAGAVLGAVVAIAELGLPVQVTGWLACAENMPGGRAQRPGDVITVVGGTTVEVLNTDAEGRLVLADALGLAIRERPDLLVDIATLTGAQRIALGARTGGVMGTDDARDAVCAAADAAGEALWPMPLPDDLRATLDSGTADIANLGDGLAGMLVAGVFLREFVPGTQQWAHIDIAGPAFNDKAPYGYVVKGGTGMGVRTFVALAARMADESAGAGHQRPPTVEG